MANRNVSKRNPKVRKQCLPISPKKAIIELTENPYLITPLFYGQWGRVQRRLSKNILKLHQDGIRIKIHDDGYFSIQPLSNRSLIYGHICDYDWFTFKRGRKKAIIMTDDYKTYNCFTSGKTNFDSEKEVWEEQDENWTL